VYSAQSGAKIPDHNVLEFRDWILALFVDGECDGVMARAWYFFFLFIGELNSGSE
jgi:hypothetical protein